MLQAFDSIYIMSTLINTRVPTRGQGSAQNGRVRPSSSLPRGEKEKCERNNLFWKFPPAYGNILFFWKCLIGIVRKRMISEFSTEQSIWDESLTKSENEEKGLACNDRRSSSGNFIRLLWTSFAFALATCHTHFPLSFPFPLKNLFKSGRNLYKREQRCWTGQIDLQYIAKPDILEKVIYNIVMPPWHL